MENKIVEQLVQAALAARAMAYAPYSQFRVGAALLGTDHQIYTGCNVENASYGLTICAERSAVCSMAQAGCRSIQAVVVALEGSGTPCGACRQVLIEFGLEFPVFAVDSATGLVTAQWKMKDLLPDCFAATDIHRGA